MAKDKRIPDLPPNGQATGVMLVPVYDPATDLTYKIQINTILAGTFAPIPENTYGTHPAFETQAELDAWQLMNGGGGGSITEEITVNVPQGFVGGYKNNDKVLPGTQVNAFAKKLLRDAANVAYNTPGLTIARTPARTIETGEIVNLTFAATYTQRDAGAMTSIKLYRDGAEIAAASPFTVQGFKCSRTPVEFQYIAEYGQGPVKNNTLGEPVPGGRIPAGSVGSPTISEKGIDKFWAGAVAQVPSSGLQVRESMFGFFENELEQGILTLNTGNTLRNFAVLVLPGCTLERVNDADAADADLTLGYVLVNSNFTGQDAGGGAVPGCKLYVLTISAPYSKNHRHNILISKTP